MNNSYIPEITLDQLHSLFLIDRDSYQIYKVGKDDILRESSQEFDIVYYATIFPPLGILPLDGKKYYEKVTYPELYDLFQRKYSLDTDPEDTFRLPNLTAKSEFLMGSPNNEDYPIDSFLDDTMINHTHGVVVHGRTPMSSASSEKMRSGRINKFTDSVGSSETAPKSIALNIGIRTCNLNTSRITRETSYGEIRNTDSGETRIVQIIE